MKATPEMIAAGAEAARKYMKETGGNSPAVIWDAMWAAMSDQPAKYDCCANCMLPRNEHVGNRCPRPHTTGWHAWDYDFSPYPSPAVKPAQQEFVCSTGLCHYKAQQSNEQVEPAKFELYHHIVLKLAEAGCKLSEQQKMVLCNLKAVTHPPVPTAQPKEPEQEPVAIKYASKAERDLYEMEDEDDTTPPQRKPLTDEGIDAAIKCAKKVDTGYAGWVRDQRKEFARAIEAAHGIKE